MSYFYYFILFLSLIACQSPKPTAAPSETRTGIQSAEKKNTKYVNSLHLLSPRKDELFTTGSPLHISFESKEKFPIDSVHYFLNGRLIARFNGNNTEYTYPLPENTKAGNNVVKITAYHPDHKIGIRSVKIQVKPAQAPHKYNYEIVKVYPHDPHAYTQGLVYQNGILYEGTGQYGESGIRKTDMKNGKILSTLNIDSKLFGEGITIYQDKIYQLTWTSHQGFIYDLKSFSLESTFNYNTQGWGITTIGQQLIMSDGSHKLYHIVPTSFNVIKEVEVYDQNGPVKNLNELEYINGLVWANVWMQDRIVMIDPENGIIKGELDMSALLSAAERQKLDDSDDVLNGIAWNPETQTIYVTGKRWPKLFEIKVRP